MERRDEEICSICDCGPAGGRFYLVSDFTPRGRSPRGSTGRNLHTCSSGLLLRRAGSVGDRVVRLGGFIDGSAIQTNWHRDRRLGFGLLAASWLSGVAGFAGMVRGDRFAGRPPGLHLLVGGNVDK